MSTTQEPLKPCPFCGSEVEIERLGDHSRSTIYQCTNCGCSLETGEEWGHGRDWNRRADDDRLASLSAELEALRGNLAGVDEKALEVARVAAKEAIKDTIGKPIDATPVLARAAIAAYLAAVRDKG